MDSHSLILGFKVDAYQKPFRIRHVADEFPQRQGEFLNKRRRGNNLLTFGQLGLLVDIDHWTAPLRLDRLG